MNRLVVAYWVYQSGVMPLKVGDSFTGRVVTEAQPAAADNGYSVAEVQDEVGRSAPRRQTASIGSALLASSRLTA